jgi:hypothetical protein
MAQRLLSVMEQITKTEHTVRLGRCQPPPEVPLFFCLLSSGVGIRRCIYICNCASSGVVPINH